MDNKYVHILDCTLRDGGYCNKWAFGESNIKKIAKGLTEAGVDVIECGFITNKSACSPSISKFNTIEDASRVLPTERNHTQYVAMINYGEYDIEQIPDRNKEFIDGIRIAFHKKNIINALDFCNKIKKKGYKIFVQAMVTMSYSDKEFLDLIENVNAIKPYAFYIVDSFGNMKKQDLIRYYSLAENNVNEEIQLGFHSHNNLQLAYSNALTLLEMNIGRNLIIDSTIYGMGRGAGNLNTELFIDYLNNHYFKNYDLKPILSIMDDIINEFYQQNPWGYSLPNYLSAVHNAHPNYAGFLADKNTLTIDMMDDIFARMDKEKKVEFDKQYIEQLYLEYMDAGRIHEQHYEDFICSIKDKIVLLIGPGKNSEIQKNKIISYVKNNDVVSISVNFLYPHVKTDYIFISNVIRYNELPKDNQSKCITTSNIPDNKSFLQVHYRDLINNNEFVKDNAGLMAAKMVSKFGAKTIVLAGFDGYSYDPLDNYAGEQRILITKKAMIDATNQGMGEIFKKISNKTKIEFLTEPIHFRLD